MTAAGSEVLIINSTISSNSSVRGGVGMFLNGNVRILSTTVAANRSTSSKYGAGGGLFANASVPEVQNTIVAGNSAATGAPDAVGRFTSLGGNPIGNAGDALVDDGTGNQVTISLEGFANGISGDLVGSADDPIDALLGPLQDNGGFTATHALLVGSRAIDAGISENVLMTDQRGVNRVNDGDEDGEPLIDIGAFEFVVMHG